MSRSTDMLESIEQEKPDYRFKAVVHAGDKWSTELPCELFLPKSPSEDAQLILEPTKEQFDALTDLQRTGIHRGSLSGRIGDDENPITIEVEKLEFGAGHATGWGTELTECVIDVHVWDLTITEGWSPSEKAQKNTYLACFQITPSRVLKPFGLPRLHRTGDVEIEYPPDGQLSIELEPGFSVTFKHHYSGRVEKTGSIVQEPRLVAECCLKGSPDDFEADKTATLLDDFLLLTSFAERQRSCLRGWSLEGTSKWVRFYRLDRVVPSYNPEHSANDYLIIDLYIQNFLQSTPAVLRKHPYRDLLRSALQSLTSEKSTVAKDFLRYFSAIETSLLVFRRQNSLEYVLDSRKDRIALKNDLKQFIQGHKLFRGSSKHHKERRALIYENFAALERVSLRSALSRFTEAYELGLDDLWPIFGEKSGWSLATIRNKIVHGEFLSESAWADVSLALEHVKWIAERMVLALLEWDIQDSKVNSSYAAEMTRLNDWIAARKRLSQG